MNVRSLSQRASGGEAQANRILGDISGNKVKVIPKFLCLIIMFKLCNI